MGGAADRPQPPLGVAWAALPKSPPACRASTGVATTAACTKLNGYSTACAVRAMPRSAGMEDEPSRTVVDAGRADGGGVRYSSMASSAVRPTSGIPHSSRGPRRSSQVGTPEEGYHFMADMTDKAMPVSSRRPWLGQALLRRFGHSCGVTHAPHHVPKEWAARARELLSGRLGQAEQMLARQKVLGVVPQGLPAHCAPRRDSRADEMARRCKRWRCRSTRRFMRAFSIDRSPCRTPAYG